MFFSTPTMEESALTKLRSCYLHDLVCHIPFCVFLGTESDVEICRQICPKMHPRLPP